MNNGSTAVIALVFFIFCFIVGSCTNNIDNSKSSHTNESSFEYRYAKERVKLEGYSDSDADKAAKAIIKFQEAQKKR